MKKLTTLALAFAFTAFIALGAEKPVEAKIVCAKCTAKIAGQSSSSILKLVPKEQIAKSVEVQFATSSGTTYKDSDASHTN